MFFVIRHCSLLEESFFRGRLADFVYCWLFGMFVLTLVDVGVFFAADYSELIPTQIMFLGPVRCERGPCLLFSFFLYFFVIA